MFTCTDNLNLLTPQTREVLEAIDIHSLQMGIGFKNLDELHQRLEVEIVSYIPPKHTTVILTNQEAIQLLKKWILENAQINEYNRRLWDDA